MDVQQYFQGITINVAEATCAIGARSTCNSIIVLIPTHTHFINSSFLANILYNYGKFNTPTEWLL